MRLLTADQGRALDVMGFYYRTRLSEAARLHGTFYEGDLDILNGNGAGLLSLPIRGDEREEYGLNLDTRVGGFSLFAHDSHPDIGRQDARNSSGLRTSPGTSSRYRWGVRNDRRATTAYHIDFAPEVYDHLNGFSKRDQSLILDTLPRQLGSQPTVETRNRKRLKANPIAPWELRVRGYRVYFEVQEEPARVVWIVAIGVKNRDLVLIGGVEVKLR